MIFTCLKIGGAMKFIDESLQSLSARLPELEWKLKALSIPLPSKKIPPSLFYNRLEMTPESCIAEIKADLQGLARQANERSARFIAEKIRQKINVLVGLCQMQSEKKPASPRDQHFGIQIICTRQQWLQSVQDDIDKLSEQQKSLAAALSIRQTGDNKQTILNLQAELGEVERRLTLAKETLARSL